MAKGIQPEEIHPDVVQALDRIEAAVFSGDTFMTVDNRNEFQQHVQRWTRWLEGTCYYERDGTLMNPDGTRSIFDDVDK